MIETEQKLKVTNQLKKPTYILAVLFMLFSTAMNSLSQEYQLSSKNKKAIKYYNVAVNNYTGNNFGAALTNLDKSVDVDPGFLEAWMLIGDIYTDLKSYNEATLAYETALSIDSTFFPPVYYFLGNIYYEKGEYDSSVKSLRTLLRIGTLSDELRLLAEKKLEKASISNNLLSDPNNIDVINIGEPINTINDEYINYVNTDFDLLMLTKRTKLPSYQSTSMRYKEELYSSDHIDSLWNTPKLVDLAWRKDGHNMGTINFSTDGRTMFFTGCYWPDNYGSCDLYYSNSVGSKWLEPNNLGATINTSTWESQPIISSDSKKLFFASKRAGGKGGSDIWMSVKLKNNQWSPPINLGDSINTAQDEMAPFLHADGNTLFFASTGHPGLGGYDLFVSRLDELGRWSGAENIGFPANSRYNEINIFSSIDGSISWISSDREGGYGNYDIYYFNNYDRIIPKEVMYVEGLVVDKETGSPLKSKVEITNLRTAEIINTTYSDSVVGNFLIVLFPGVDYAFNISKKGYLFHSENINLEDSIGQKSIKKRFELSPFKSGNQLVMNNIFFEFNKHRLLPSSYIELDKLVNVMVENPEFKIEISGHTDNIGSDSYNMELSGLRAKSVGNYLMEKGVNKDRLIFTAKGSSEPMAANDTEEGRSQNRRTEILIR